MAYQTQLVAVSDKMGGRFYKIMTREAGKLPIFQLAASFFDFTQACIKSLFAGRRIVVHERVVPCVKAIITETDSDRFARRSILGMTFQAFLHGQYPACLSQVIRISIAEPENHHPGYNNSDRCEYTISLNFHHITCAERSMSAVG